MSVSLLPLSLFQVSSFLVAWTSELACMCVPVCVFVCGHFSQWDLPHIYIKHFTLEKAAVNLILTQCCMTGGTLQSSYWCCIWYFLHYVTRSLYILVSRTLHIFLHFYESFSYCKECGIGMRAVASGQCRYERASASHRLGLEGLDYFWIYIIPAFPIREHILKVLILWANCLKLFLSFVNFYLKKIYILCM